MSRLTTTPLLLALLAATFAGCGLQDPYDDRAPEARAARAASPESPAGGERPSEDPSPSQLEPEPSAFPGAGTTPRATLTTAALLAGNWTSATAPRAYDRLTALSVGEARAEFDQIAAGARTDVGQTTSGSRSRATVEAVTVRPGRDVRSAVVVTRERMTTPEIAHLPAEYKVTLAEVERHGESWVISRWEPKP